MNKIRLKTRIFELEEAEDMKALARRIGLSFSEFYRIRQGKRGISGQFIINVLTAFPGRKFEDLFYIERQE